MVRLWALVIGQDPSDIDRRDIQFPIYGLDPANPDADAAFAAARGKYESAVGELRKEPNFSGYLARIHELQPL